MLTLAILALCGTAIWTAILHQVNAVRGRASDRAQSIYGALLESDHPENSGWCEPSAMEDLKEIEKEFGRVRSFRIEATGLKLDGLWELDLIVERVHAACDESVHNTGRDKVSVVAARKDQKRAVE